MTPEELRATIKAACGPMVADAVREYDEKHVQPLRARQDDWIKHLVTGRPGDGAAAAPPEVPLKDMGLAFARCVRATAAAKISGQGPGAAIEILKQWGNHDLAEKWAEARQKALAAGDATAGGFLVPTQFAAEVIEFLRARAVVRRMGTPTMPVGSGTLKIPKLSGGATAYYVGENTNATKSEETTGQITLTFKKLVTLVPMSNDLIRYSSPGADAIVRNDIVNAMRVKEDESFIRGTGSDNGPKGLRYWAHADHVISANSSVSVANVYSDLGKLIQRLLDANIPMISPGWLMAPRVEIFLRTLINSNGFPVFRDEMARGTLLGYPFASTTSIPINLDVSGTDADDESEIYFADFAQAIIGESLNLVVDASQEAAYHDGSAVVAAYSQDQTVVRAIAEHDFALRYDKAVAVLTQVDWAPGSV